MATSSCAVHSQQCRHQSLQGHGTSLNLPYSWHCAPSKCCAVQCPIRSGIRYCLIKAVIPLGYHASALQQMPCMTSLQRSMTSLYSGQDPPGHLIHSYNANENLHPVQRTWYITSFVSHQQVVTLQGRGTNRFSGTAHCQSAGRFLPGCGHAGQRRAHCPSWVDSTPLGSCPRPARLSILRCLHSWITRRNEEYRS